MVDVKERIAPSPGSPVEGPETDAKARPALPRRYKVLLFNDDYTPAAFVVSVLMQVFRLGEEAARAITIETHSKGVGLCGVFGKDVAETKAASVVSLGNKSDFPLRAGIEPE